MNQWVYRNDYPLFHGPHYVYSTFPCKGSISCMLTFRMVIAAYVRLPPHSLCFRGCLKPCTNGDSEKYIRQIYTRFRCTMQSCTMLHYFVDSCDNQINDVQYWLQFISLDPTKQGCALVARLTGEAKASAKSLGTETIFSICE